MPKEKRNTKDRKQQIVDATLKCIVDLGYSDVTMQTISSYSGLSKGAIHHYFKTKEDILLSAFRELDLKLYRSVDSKLKGTKDMKELLSKRIEGPFELVKTDQPLFLCLTEFLTISDKKVEYQEAIKRFFDKYRKLIGWGFETGIKEGIYREVNLSLISSIMLALLFGLEIQWRVDKKAFDIDEIVKMITEMFFQFVERAEP